MFVEQRLYTFAPGKGGEFDRIYQAVPAMFRNVISERPSVTITARLACSIR